MTPISGTDICEAISPERRRLMSGKVAIITGCNSSAGIGRATAIRFAQQHVHALYICDQNDDKLIHHAKDLQSNHPHVKVHPRCFDASDETAVSAIVDDAFKTYGRLDIFFANAGISGSHTRLHDTSAEGFMHIIKVNAQSVFLAIKHASRVMVKTSSTKSAPGGVVLATASTAGVRSNAGPTDYSASKAAVISIVQTACYQLAGTGVRTNAICPGLIQTEMTEPMFVQAKARGTQAKIGQLNPMGRAGSADEIASVATFLASDEASYVNGQAWLVDGGLSAGHPFIPGKLA